LIDVKIKKVKSVVINCYSLSMWRDQRDRKFTIESNKFVNTFTLFTINCTISYLNWWSMQKHLLCIGASRSIAINSNYNRILEDTPVVPYESLHNTVQVVQYILGFIHISHAISPNNRVSPAIVSSYFSIMDGSL